MKILFYFGMLSVFIHFYPFYTFVLLWSVVWIIFVALCWDMGVELVRRYSNQEGVNDR
jgi:hypothetical protein